MSNIGKPIRRTILIPEIPVIRPEIEPVKTAPVREPVPV